MAAKKQKGDSCLSNLRSSIRQWSDKRQETVQTLRRLANELMKHYKNVHIAKVAGSTASIGGFALIAAGFGLAPVTLGLSTILSAVGGAICGAGGATVAGSNIVEIGIFKNRLAAAQKIIDADRTAQERVTQNLKLLRLAYNTGTFGKNVYQMATNFVELDRAGAAAGRGSEALLRSLGVGANAVRIGMFSFNAFLLPFDISTLVNSSIEIDTIRKEMKDKEPKAVQNLRELANSLENEMYAKLRDLNEF